MTETTTTARWDTDILADLIAKKHDLLVQLRTLTLQQVEVVATNQLRDLMTLLSAKQTLLNQVQRLEQGLDHFRQQDPEARKWRTPEARLACRAKAELCEQLVSELVTMEKASESTMLQRRDGLSNQLNLAGNAANARAAYTGQQFPTRGGFDIQSEG